MSEPSSIYVIATHADLELVPGESDHAELQQQMDDMAMADRRTLAELLRAKEDYLMQRGLIRRRIAAPGTR